MSLDFYKQFKHKTGTYINSQTVLKGGFVELRVINVEL